MNWTNMQISNGFNFNFFDSNSHYFSRLREDSLSQAPLFQHQGHHMFNISSFEAENTINFQDLAKTRKRHSDPFIADLSLSNQESRECPHQFSLGKVTKGLKDLAKLLIQAIRSCHSFTQVEIVKLIENQLCHLHPEKVEEKIKTEKNIKRRIYDALNVMISAGLLQREAAQIRVKPKQTVQAFNSKARGEMEIVKSRIEKKRELLFKLKSQKKALNCWIEHNRRNKSQEREKHLEFPLIFVLKDREDIWMNIWQQLVMMRNGGLQFLSETDIIQKLYQLQASKHLTAQQAEKDELIY